jgi:hypothetical protein
MLDFLTFLTEAKDTGPEHVHDLAIGHGNDGVAKSGMILDAVHKKLLGKHSAINVTTEYDDEKNKDPVMKPTASNYTINDQRRFLDHMENAKRVYSQMKPDSMDRVGIHGHHLKAHLSSLGRMSEPPKTDGFVDYLTKQHDKTVKKTDHSIGEDKKRHGYSNAIQHVLKNRPHYDKALELHHHLGKAKDVLHGVIAKNYKQQGSTIGSKGAVATGYQGTARIAKKK